MYGNRVTTFDSDPDVLKKRLDLLCELEVKMERNPICAPPVAVLSISLFPPHAHTHISNSTTKVLVSASSTERLKGGGLLRLRAGVTVGSSTSQLKIGNEGMFSS